MAANPITELEFEAFCRRRHIRPTIWEGDMLMRLDDEVLAAKANPSAAATDDPDPSDRSAPVTDRKAVRGLLAGIGERMRSRRRG